MDFVASLIKQLVPDAWRQDVGFSNDLETAQSQILQATSDTEVSSLLNEWLQRYQPCLFGRMAAKAGQLSFCILREPDLQQSDSFIREKIQECRTQWTRDGFHGLKSGFIILAVSESLAGAEPNEVVAKLAQCLGSLYLLEELSFDHVHLEEIFLEQPGRTTATWRWDAGINYFAAHGDKRWWHDHRIPGGIGFSINSVGHMAKSGLLSKALAEVENVMGTGHAGEKFSKIDSLMKALEVAMRTIDMAADTEWGRATQLFPLPANIPPCPAVLPQFLQNRDYSQYFGAYHTDYTLPSEYFGAEIGRPPHLRGHTLDFTYLFDERIDNPDYIRMGTGRRIRGDLALANNASADRVKKWSPNSLPISEAHRLAAALVS